ncbi:ATP-binding protein [Janthinobacterium sp.]|uniref:sensor histidine kinase n=1 Tax=Janthinobacterium sp. TaxID=1871054 RepID=UPI00293D8639|nr:ATP-binding protein [Janthinobacterium sp.]
MRPFLLRYLPYPLFVGLYLVFDWVSYIDPLYGLNITPWNPDPALGLVFWLAYGRRAALPWFVALLAGEVLVRGMPAGPLVSVLGALWLTFGYGLTGAALRRSFSRGDIFDNRRRLFVWVGIVLAGTAVNGVGFISLLQYAGLIPRGAWGLAVLRFGIGDLVGVLVSMPLLWMLASAAGRARLRATVWRWETAGYLALSCGVLWGVFGSLGSAEFKHFYFLFLPVIWAASRQGLYGTALIVFVLQLGIIALVKWTHAVDIEVYELQMLDAMLALVGFFIGIVVDELRKVAEELKHTLRLAAAGEMAAALAHELNQPLAALATYGKACEYLLERGDGGALLQGAIRHMIVESDRAAEVVRRLRDFFRTGAMQLEAVRAGALVQAITQQFQAQFRLEGVEFSLSEPEALLVHADRLQIELVLRNLLANALESVLARPRGARRVWISAERLGGGRLRLSVEDSGAGVSSALAARLFEPFVSSKASGLGLGLVLSRAIVEAHGGSLWAEVGQHGMFRFVLPLAESEDYLAN